MQSTVKTVIFLLFKITAFNLNILTKNNISIFSVILSIMIIRGYFAECVIVLRTVVDS